MNRNEWLSKFEGYNIWLNSMLDAIPNFDRLNRKDDFVIEKSKKYYTQLNIVSLKILENRKMPYMRLSTFDMENRVECAKELLKETLEKRRIPNELYYTLPKLGTI